MESENQQSLNLEFAEQKPVIEEIEDTEKETGTEEVIIDTDKVGKIRSLSRFSSENYHL